MGEYSRGRILQPITGLQFCVLGRKEIQICYEHVVSLGFVDTNLTIIFCNVVVPNCDSVKS